MWGRAQESQGIAPILTPIKVIKADRLWERGTLEPPNTPKGNRGCALQKPGGQPGTKSSGFGKTNNYRGEARVGEADLRLQVFGKH